MADKKKEDKIVLEREYVVPIRKKANMVPRYRRTPKAIKIVREFVERHMQVRENPHKNIRFDKYLNEEIWSRSIRKPPAKLRIKCKKFESGKVIVELVELPANLKFKKEREQRSKEEIKKYEEKKKEEKKEEKTEASETKEEKKEDAEKKVEETEKKDAVVEAGLQQADLQAKQAKHEVAGVKAQKSQSIQRTRKAMQR